MPGGKSKACVCGVYAGGCFPGCVVFFLFCQTRPCGAQTGSYLGWDGSFPTWGGNRAHGAFWGRTGALGGFVGRLAVGGFLQCRKERKGRKNPLEGRGRNLRHLPGLFQGCKEAMRTSVPFSSHTICRRFYGSNHKMSKCTLSQFAPLHPLFFSQPIPLVGQADGLHIAS